MLMNSARPLVDEAAVAKQDSGIPCQVRVVISDVCPESQRRWDRLEAGKMSKYS